MSLMHSVLYCFQSLLVLFCSMKTTICPYNTLYWHMYVEEKIVNSLVLQ